MAKIGNTVKLLNEERTSYLRYPYEDNNISFAISGAIDKGKVPVLSDVYHCREQLGNEMKELITTVKRTKFSRTYILAFSSALGPGVNVVISGKATKGVPGLGPLKQFGEGIGRHLFSYDNWMDKVAKASLNIVNHFEKANKWLQTKAYKVIINNKKYANKCAYYFVGSKWWIYTPHNFSLFLLLLRLGKFEETQSLRSNMSRNAFTDALKKVKIRSYGVNLVANPELWYILTGNRKEIYNHHKDMIGCWSIPDNYSEGVVDFVRGDTADKEAFCKFRMVSKLNK